MALLPIPENFRAEIARFKIPRQDLCDVIGMNKNLLSMYLSGSRPLPPWASHNIGLGLNMMMGRRLFEIDATTGLRPAPMSVPPTVSSRRPRAGEPRDPRNPLVMPSQNRRSRRRFGRAKNNPTSGS